MRNLFFALLVFSSTFAFSQGIRVVSNKEVPISNIGGSFHPVLSPTGDYLVVTGSSLQGLHKFDLNTQQLTTITTEPGAGFRAQISSDGSTIVYRTTEYKNKLRYATLNSININTGKKSQLVKNTRDLQGVSIKEGTILAIEDGKMKSKRLSGNKLSSIPAVPSIKEGQLYITQNGKTKLISPAGTNQSYLWASVSPDGTKLVYYVMGHGKAYVSNLDGSNPVSLGILRAPTWLGNDWIVGMVDKDNGEIMTASKLVAVASDGTGRTNLTDESVMATNPSASADATKIVYNAGNGKVFLMQVEISK